HYDSLPYRPCVGIMVINPKGRVFIGKRRGGAEHVDATHSWQMPQGGVDDREDTYKAALREMLEEDSIRSGQKLAEEPGWLSYDLPRAIVEEACKGRFRGQTQKWYALRFTGRDSEIDIAHPPGGHKPEFTDWRWETMDELPGLIIPFKRPVYERVVKEFARF